MAPFEIDELLHEQGFVAVELEGAEGVDERLVSAPQQRQHAAGTCADTSVTTIRQQRDAGRRRKEPLGGALSLPRDSSSV